MREADGRTAVKGVTLSPSAKARATTWLVWTLLVLGAVGTCGRVLGNGAEAKAPPPPGRLSPGPGAWAELYVAAWLQATEGDDAKLRAFWPAAPTISDRHEGGQVALNTTTLAVGEVAGKPGYWSVVVGAVVVAPSGSRSVHFYQVGVREDPPQSFTAAGFPGEVSAPPTGEALRLEHSLEAPSPTDPLAGFVARFFDAYLTGRGAVVDYAGSASGLRPVTPSPFAALELTGVAHPKLEEAKGAPVAVRAELTGVTAEGRRQRLHYALEVDQREGRWVVLRLLPAPPLDESEAPSADLMGTTTTTTPPASFPSPTTTATPQPKEDLGD